MQIKSSKNTNLSVIGHLDELRQRIIYCLIFFILSSALGFIFAKEMIQILIIPSKDIIQNLIITKPTEIISVYIKISFYIGIILALPVILYNLWRFVRPALNDDLRFSPYPWISIAFALSIVGSFFSYKVIVPKALLFLANLSKDLATSYISLGSYISFIVASCILGSLVFQMPLLSAFFTRLTIINPSWLKKKRKEAIFVLFVIAALLTPTTDIFNMLVFVVPMLGLYEISIFTSLLIYNIYNKEKHIEEIYGKSY